MDLSLPIALPARYRFPWRAVVGTLLGACLLGGGWVWLRDSSLVAVNQVQISGVRGAQAVQIESLLRSTAQRMTTMDFNAGALRSAVAAFPVVASVHASPGFPHSVRIQVIERPPVAALLAGGQRTALAADGTALGAQLASGSLPTLSGSFAPIPGQRVSDGSLRAELSVLGAAPPVVARFIARAYEGPEGLTVAMRNGLLVYFGDSSRPHAKWVSLAAVLADPSSAGARYVDVRVPERPAAGVSGTSSVTPMQPVGSGSAADALAERLEQTVGGGASAAAAAAGSAASGESETTQGASRVEASAAPEVKKPSSEAQPPAGGHAEAVPAGGAQAPAGHG
ncbi:MAG: cell division protein FtsQ/DivIB [Solirubrobacteraceae bacterium]